MKGRIGDGKDGPSNTGNIIQRKHMVDSKHKKAHTCRTSRRTADTSSLSFGSFMKVTLSKICFKVALVMPTDLNMRDR